MSIQHFHYWARYFIILFVGFVVTMTLSFFLVQYLVRDLKLDRDRQEISRLQGEQLRGHSNYLVDLTHQYLRSVPNSEGPIPAKTRQWLNLVYRPQLEDYSATLLEVSTPWAIHINQLRSAADRALIMSLHPENGSVRKHSLLAIYETVQAVETYLSSQGYANKLQANALKPNWADAP